MTSRDAVAIAAERQRLESYGWTFHTIPFKSGDREVHRLLSGGMETVRFEPPLAQWRYYVTRTTNHPEWRDNDTAPLSDADAASLDAVFPWPW